MEERRQAQDMTQFIIYRSKSHSLAIPSHQPLTDPVNSHLKEYHTVVRCQLCYQVFKGDTAMTSKNEHQRTCNTQEHVVTDDVIDCDMKTKLTQELRRFRNWSFKKNEDKDKEMNAWISSCITALTALTQPRAELGEVDLKNLVYGERELAKWYTYWTTLFPNLPIPEHPCELPPLTINPHAHHLSSLRA
jgi:hypothetical protein